MRLRRHIVLLALAWLLLGFPAGLAQLPFPTSAGASASPSPSASPDPASERLKLEERLDEVESSLREAPSPTPSAEPESPDEPASYYNSLLRIEASLRRMLSLEEAEALLGNQLERVDSEASSFTQNGLEERRPYPITLLDDLQYQLSLAEDDLRNQEASLTSARADAKMAQEQLEQQQALRRRILDRAAISKSGSLDLDRASENASWAVKAMDSVVEVTSAEVELAEKSRLLAQKQAELLGRKVALVNTHFLFTRAILEEQLGRLDDERAEVTRAHQAAETEADRALEQVKALEASGTSNPANEAERDARTEWLTTYQRQKLLLEQRLELNLSKRDLWERRFELSQGLALASLSDWDEATDGQVSRLQAQRDTLNAQLAQLRGSLTAVVESAADGPPAVQRWRNEQAKALAAHQTALEETLADAGATYQLAQRLSSEIQATRRSLSWRERVARAWGLVVDMWQIELYSVGDSSVTIGKVIIAMLVLAVGLTLARRTTRFVSRRLLSHLPLPDNTRQNIERGMRSFFVLMVFLFALRVVNIPLTIFTFLGGTLAIAVGFGAQNILNNFISGLILMAERPVRVGDLIEVDQTTGVIEEIGARSTRVRMATGIHVVLPNSVLLENKVVNWTLTDQVVRSSVTVGVEYGTDPRTVMGLISRATLSIETIEKTPPHFVMLEDFGESSLIFTVNFWVSIVEPLNKKRSESQLRIAIAELFAEHGISIPFPRRDLTVTQPVPVRILPDTSKENPEL